MYGNWTFRSQDHSLPRSKVPGVELSLPGTFVPWNFRTLELSLPGTFVPWNFRTLGLSLPGTFAPWNFRSLEWERKKAKRKFKLIFVCDFFPFLSAQPDVYSAQNHQSLISLCITSSLESTSCLIPRALHKTPC